MTEPNAVPEWHTELVHYLPANLAVTTSHPLMVGDGFSPDLAAVNCARCQDEAMQAVAHAPLIRLVGTTWEVECACGWGAKYVDAVMAARQAEHHIKFIRWTAEHATTQEVSP